MSVKGTAHDRWKRKDWYQVLSPALFKEALVGEILSADPKQLVGRTIETTASELTGDLRKSHMNVTFRIISVDGKKARTTVEGFDLAKSYVRSLVRRRASKIDANVKVDLRDGAIVRIKPIVVSFRKCDTSQKQVIRKLLLDKIGESASGLNLDNLLLDTISDKVIKTARDEIKKVYPVKNVEVRMIELVRRPQAIATTTMPTAPTAPEVEAEATGATIVEVSENAGIAETAAEPTTAEEPPAQSPPAA